MWQALFSERACVNLLGVIQSCVGQARWYANLGYIGGGARVLGLRTSKRVHVRKKRCQDMWSSCALLKHSWFGSWAFSLRCLGSKNTITQSMSRSFRLKLTKSVQDMGASSVHDVHVLKCLSHATVFFPTQPDMPKYEEAQSSRPPCRRRNTSSRASSSKGL
jgi:hypothetical protein